MKRLVLIILLLITLLLPVVPVSADTSAEVTVTAVGFIVAAPGGFTLTYISDYEVGISWIKPVGADNTMIRASYGGIPESMTDGYLVYYGDLEYTSDTGVNFFENIGEVYYRAWSQNETGLWETTGVSNSIEGVAVLLGILVFLSLVLTIGGYALHRGSLAFASMAAWMVVLVYSYGEADGVWGVYMLSLIHI